MPVQGFTLPFFFFTKLHPSTRTETRGDRCAGKTSLSGEGPAVGEQGDNRGLSLASATVGFGTHQQPEIIIWRSVCCVRLLK